jgi:hypothetical protein
MPKLGLKPATTYFWKVAGRRWARGSGARAYLIPISGQ